MFGSCHNLESLDVNFDTSKVTDMSGMFGQCYRLKALNLQSFDTSHVVDMREMFMQCSSLKTVTIAVTVGQDALTYNIFKGCSANII